MIPDIISKLQQTISNGIKTEAQVVYVLVQIRKILEQQGNAAQQYEYLKFYCDWALHTKLSGRFTQTILQDFNSANIELRNGLELHELPKNLQSQIEQIIKMQKFREELSNFSLANDLPSLDRGGGGWPHFLHLYAKIIKDSPLEMKADNTTVSIEKVIVDVELAQEIQHHQQYYKVKWTIFDRNGSHGTLFVINSFTVN
ncbi:MAG: hypothetical protein ACK502_02945 [Alphaproteobacteria bacterium]